MKCCRCGIETDGNSGLWIDDVFEAFCHPDLGPSCYEDAQAELNSWFAKH